jgi:ribonuclease P/MRP protein subunit RPP1
MLQKATELGFSETAVTNINIKDADGFATRIDLEPKNSKDFMESIKRNRKKFEVVSVICHSKKIANKAAQDQRVDILLYSNQFSVRSKTWFNRQQASLAKESGCYYEINANQIIKADLNLTFLLKQLKKEVLIAQKTGVPIIISSGATSIFEMREPRALIAMLGLLDIQEEDALNMVSANPGSKLQINRSKLKNKYISPGIWRT